MEANCFTKSEPDTLWRKVHRKLIPWNPCELPEAPPTWLDVVITTTHCQLSITDRLRVLFTGKIEVETRTVTENMVGGCKTASICRPGH